MLSQIMPCVRNECMDVHTSGLISPVDFIDKETFKCPTPAEIIE